MKILKVIIILAMTAFLGACASGKKSTSSTYTSDYYMQTPKSISKKVCPADVKIQATEKLEQFMKYANGCVKNGNWNKVKKIGSKILEKHTKTPWGAYFLSVHAENAKQIPRALWMIDLAIKKAPNMGVLYYQKSRLLWASGDVYSSVSIMKKSLSLDDSLLQAHLFMANLYTRDHLYEKAYKHYKKVLKEDSDNYQALLGMSEYYIFKKDKINSEKYLDDVLSENPKNLSARINLAKVYESSFQDYEKAITMYSRAKRYYSSSHILKHTGVDVEIKIKDLNSLWKQQKEAQRKVSSTSVPKKQGVKK